MVSLQNFDAAATLRNLSAKSKQAFFEFKRKVQEDLPIALEQVKDPGFLRDRADTSTRVSQLMAALMLGPFIVVNLAIIRVIADLMTGVFGPSELDSTHTGIIAWMITAIILGTLILSAWAWFQWVRTGGFGVFNE